MLQDLTELKSWGGRDLCPASTYAQALKSDTTPAIDSWTHGAGCDWSQECLSYLSGVAVKEAVEKKAMGAFCLKKGAAPAPDHEAGPLNSLLRLATGTMVCRPSWDLILHGHV